jgi:peptide/nickel transport system ATP-binding protein
MTLLRVENLTVEFDLIGSNVKAVNGVSFSLEQGKTLGFVGESGSGKSVTAQSILGLVSGSNAKISGSVFLNGQQINYQDEKSLRPIRGKEIAIVFQDPLSSLHPFYKIGDQIMESYLVHHPDAKKGEALEQTLRVMAEVGIPSPQTRVNDYPHQFSGGMRQRIMIAMALINRPKLLIADEPTTALDVTVQAQILALLKRLQVENNMAILLITHDFGVVSEMCDDVVVMYAGRAIETASAEKIFASPEHPYTRGLLDSLVGNDDVGAELIPIPGTPPSAADLPEGCAFAPRCAWSGTDGMNCTTERPELIETSEGHSSACFLPSKNRSDLLVRKGIK